MKEVDLILMRQRLSYDAETGVIRWKESGKEAGTLTSHGYRQIRFAGKFLYAHRIAWAFIFGKWPDHQIDHVDGNRLNNSARNLRDIPVAINNQNRKKANKNNSTKLLGAYFDKQIGKWKSSITLNGRSKHIGVFENAEQAHAAYVQAKRALHEGNTL